MNLANFFILSVNVFYIAFWAASVFFNLDLYLFLSLLYGTQVFHNCQPLKACGVISLTKSQMKCAHKFVLVIKLIISDVISSYSGI